MVVNIKLGNDCYISALEAAIYLVKRATAVQKHHDIYVWWEATLSLHHYSSRCNFLSSSLLRSFFCFSFSFPLCSRNPVVRAQHTSEAVQGWQEV